MRDKANFKRMKAQNMKNKSEIKNINAVSSIFMVKSK